MSAIAIGDILKVQFPAARPPGHEQIGTRPAIVVGMPDRLGPPRFPGLIVVPLTTQSGADVNAAPALYPVFKAGQGGLTAHSMALLDNVRALGVPHILGRLGSLSEQEYAPVAAALRKMGDV